MKMQAVIVTARSATTALMMCLGSKSKSMGRSQSSEAASSVLAKSMSNTSAIMRWEQHDGLQLHASKEHSTVRSLECSPPKSILNKPRVYGQSAVASM